MLWTFAMLPSEFWNQNSEFLNSREGTHAFLKAMNILVKSPIDKLVYIGYTTSFEKSTNHK